MVKLFSSYQHYLGNTSKSYRIALLVQFILHLLLTWVVMRTILVIEPNGGGALMARSLLEATLMVTVCHLLLRPYLRCYLLGSHLDAPMIFKGIGYHLLVGTLYMGLTLWLSDIELFNQFDVTNIQMETDKGTVTTKIERPTVWLLGSIETAFTLLSWSGLYLLIKHFMNRRALQQEVNRSQIQQLTNQLSPHFLFNTLNSIRALIYADQEKAAHMVDLISALFRSQMQSQLKVKSSLGEEWQITQNYLEIEAVRFGQRLTVDNQLDSVTLPQQLPTLTLLTLAENAVKHGIAPSSQNGFIRFESRVIDNNKWQLLVTNSLFNDVKDHGTRVGLRNINKRFELMFGEQYQLQIEQGSQQYQIRLELPYA